MSLSSVLASIRYWGTDGTWGTQPSYPLTTLSAADQSAIKTSVQTLYGSQTLQPLLDSYVTNGGFLRFGNGGSNKDFAAPNTDTTYGGYIGLDLSQTVVTWDSLGRLHSLSTNEVLAHELGHLTNGNDVDPVANPSQATMNGASFDNQGASVRFENQVMRDLGATYDVRSSYYATFDTTDHRYSELGGQTDFTGGHAISFTRLGTDSADIIDLSARGTSNSILVLGLEGDDSITGSNGADYLYGNAGADIITGGVGNDQMFGGAGNDTFKPDAGFDLFKGGDQSTSAHTAAQLAADGSDTADYSGLTGIGVKISITTTAVDKTFASDPDIAHAVFVTDLGRQHDTDTLVSVEKIIGSQSNDTLSIQSFSSQLLSNSSHLGGVDTIDLSGQNAGPTHGGDTVDLSAVGTAVTVSVGASTASAFATNDTTHKLTIAGAENYIGSAYNDVLTSSSSANLSFDGGAGNDTILGGSGSDLIRGGSGTNQLSGGAGADKIISTGTNDVITGGAGNDIIELNSSSATINFGPGDGSDVVQFDLKPGTYGLKLSNLNAADIDVIGGGFDAYYVMNESDQTNYPDGEWYQFLTIRDKATGDQITFLENGLGGTLNIGPTPGQDPPIGYNKGFSNPNYLGKPSNEGQLDSITFQDGSSWNQAAIWNHLSKQDEWAYAVGNDTHGYGSGAHNETNFLSYVNQTYLQAFTSYVA